MHALVSFLNEVFGLTWDWFKSVELVQIGVGNQCRTMGNRLKRSFFGKDAHLMALGWYNTACIDTMLRFILFINWYLKSMLFIPYGKFSD